MSFSRMIKLCGTCPDMLYAWRHGPMCIDNECWGCSTPHPDTAVVRAVLSPKANISVPPLVVAAMYLDLHPHILPVFVYLEPPWVPSHCPGPRHYNNPPAYPDCTQRVIESKHIGRATDRTLRPRLEENTYCPHGSQWYTFFSSAKKRYWFLF
jgi:hypothetical protein